MGDIRHQISSQDFCLFQTGGHIVERLRCLDHFLCSLQWHSFVQLALCEAMGGSRQPAQGGSDAAGEQHTEDNAQHTCDGSRLQQCAINLRQERPFCRQQVPLSS